MELSFRHVKAILAAFPVFVAALLSGCGSGCGTLGVANTSPCDSTTLSGTTPSTSTFNISGTVNGAVQLGAVTINLTGTTIPSATTDASGAYIFKGLPVGSYTVVPSSGTNKFNPVSTAVTISGADGTADFAETASTAVTSSLSGTVSGAVTQNVLITLSEATNGTAVTDANGAYSFSGLAVGTNIVTPKLGVHTFTPPSNTVITDSTGIAHTGINFTAQ